MLVFKIIGNFMDDVIISETKEHDFKNKLATIVLAIERVIGTGRLCFYNKKGFIGVSFSSLCGICNRRCFVIYLIRGSIVKRLMNSFCIIILKELV